MASGTIWAVQLPFLLSGCVAAEQAQTGSTRAPELVSFKLDIAPVLNRKCVTCHGSEKSKSKYRLDSFERLMTPGESKELPITPGDPSHSKLYQLITATDPDDRMPQGEAGGGDGVAPTGLGGARRIRLEVNDGGEAVPIARRQQRQRGDGQDDARQHPPSLGTMA